MAQPEPTRTPEPPIRPYCNLTKEDGGAPKSTATEGDAALDRNGD